jgi:hypothetical protein
MCGRRLAVKHFLAWRGHVSGLLVQPFFMTAGPDVVRKWVPIKPMGSTPVTRKKVRS